jgi:hypothetical protein
MTTRKLLATDGRGSFEGAREINGPLSTHGGGEVGVERIRYETNNWEKGLVRLEVGCGIGGREVSVL